MPGNLTFEIYRDASEERGIFSPVDDDYWYKITEEFDNQLDVQTNAFPDFCKRLIKAEPLFLDAYAHIGMWLLPDNLCKAAKWYKTGVDLGCSLLPEGFSGQIQWSSLDNRPFLRCHHGHILCLIRQKKFKTALLEAEKHLKWNSNDNIGVRFLLGELLLITNDFKKAKALMDEHAADMPSYLYSLGLLSFLQGDYVPSITYFRKGFMANPYLAQMITGHTNVLAHGFWHFSSRMRPRDAFEFMDLIGDELWNKFPRARVFLDWLFNCSMILKERGFVTECREQLLSEHDFHKRREILRREDEIQGDITDDSSQILVKRMQTRRKECWPWEAMENEF